MFKKMCIALAVASGLTGCAVVNPYPEDKVDSKFPHLEGMPISSNHTPYSPSLVCLAEESATNTQYMNQYRHSISVGHIKDLTGKYDYENGGYKITQGASDMMLSALFKTSAFRIVDRGNMEITELERSLAAQKLVREFDLNDNQRLRQITAGEVIGSDYKIVGSINELNYNIYSGGVEVNVSQVNAVNSATVNFSGALNAANNGIGQSANGIAQGNAITVASPTNVGAINLSSANLINVGSLTIKP